MENENLATELLHEVRKQSKRWFIAFIIMVAVELATIFSFMWYISLPVEDVKVESSDNGNANYIGNDLNGDINNGESDRNKEGNTEQKEIGQHTESP